MTDVTSAPLPVDGDKPGTDERIFLVVVDDSEEFANALRFACRRAKSTGGRVALLRVCEPTEFQHWVAVGDLMREEAREEAEQLLQRLAETVNHESGQLPVLYVREGKLGEEVVRLIDEEPAISILVLGAATGNEGPGPLVTTLTTRLVGRLRVPVTVVPGNMGDADIDKVS